MMLTRAILVLIKDGTLKYGETLDEDESECSIWGPTCDSIDCLVEKTRLPTLDVGDWIYWENMGAYTICAASQFNGFKKTEIIYTNTFGV